MFCILNCRLKSKKDAQIPTVEETNIDCAVDYQSPPIENEEWLAFMRKTMHELLEGEFESMKEKSMVRIQENRFENH